ncbi:MAG: hypothetical protein EPN57_03370 [Paraburkholderia sp.]|nr:MAG: hypothetical protein EPN57_03370 [Paraburkholderia sp.]
MGSIAKLPPDAVLNAAKKVTSMSLLLPGLAAGLSYAAYADDLAASAWPWRIGLFVTLACLLAPFIIYTKARQTNALWACGAIAAIGIFAVYYFFGVFSYFYYFMFAPMPHLVSWLGFFGGVTLTVYWMIMIGRGVRHTIRSTSFVETAFIDDGDVISYRIQTGMRAFERLNKERLPFPKIYLYVVYGIAPFYLILNRLFSENFGQTGVLLFLAILGMPVSLWFAGLLVRICLVMIVLPLKIERERHRRVVVVE